ncbi:glycerophosphodiester phosphodiesterase [Bacillus testis]|uniref:glycerophosphodiester phosphodiesterase n=1 Tax=Bacillus testis TaxID=1622072 RepID=UPI00067F21AC|nr:glycerophosphodiester phosphodiesterase family protein [Bacillus testis]
MPQLLLGIGVICVLGIYALYHRRLKTIEFASNKEKPLIIAHRGSSGVYPENTKAAFDAAVNAGADYLELDIQLSKDNCFMVIHDATIDRTSNDSGEVNGFSEQELKQLDMGTWKNAAYKGEVMMTLPEVLSAYLPKISLLIEVKHIKDIKKTAALLAEELHKHSLPDGDRIIIQSFDRSFIEYFHTLMPDIAVGVLVRKVNSSLVNSLRPFAAYINPKITVATPANIELIQKAGCKCVVWTVHTEQDRARLAYKKMDGIATDYPEWYT